MIRLPDGWLALVAFSTLILLHIHVAPYTKVEESFNMQASHDILAYGIPRSNVSGRLRAEYDHMSFPGAVPRTFIGALLLSALSKPFLWLKHDLDRQFLVRAVLGCLNALSLASYARQAGKAFGKATAAWYLCLQASQFHLIYYASRPLPNMFAFAFSMLPSSLFLLRVMRLSPVPATTALSLLLPKAAPVPISHGRICFFVFLLAITATVFRSEVAILLFCHVAYLVLQNVARFGRFNHAASLLRASIVPAGVIGGIVGLSLTVPIDTFFWQSPSYLWPELSAFLFNIFPTDANLGASAWGTSPWHWYWSNALPRLLMNPLLYLVLWPLSLGTTATSKPAMDLLVPNLAYIAIYSFVPHKETRFIFCVVPPLTLASALSCSYIWTRRQKAPRTRLHRITGTAIILSTLLSALISHALLVPLSSLSYPGGHALNRLHQITRQHGSNNISESIHLDNLSTQTGITRFLQNQHQQTANNTITLHFDKCSNQPDTNQSKHTYTITESPHLMRGKWDTVATIDGLKPGRGLQILNPGEKRADGGPVHAHHDRCSLEAHYWHDGIDAVIAHMYGSAWPGRVSVALRLLLREGCWMRRPRMMAGTGSSPWSWTAGWWLDVAWLPRLHVLRSNEEGGVEGG